MNRNKQNGAALVVSMILLLLIGIMTLSMAKTAQLDLIVGNNSQFQNEAFQSAETGIVASMAELENRGLTNLNDLLTEPFTLTRGNSDTNTFFDVIVIDNDDGDGDMSTDSDDVVGLVSQGTSSAGATRTVSVWIGLDTSEKNFSLDKAIMTSGDLRFGGEAELHGTNQDIHSNGDIYKGDKPITSGTISASGTVYATDVGDFESMADRIDIPEINPSEFAEYAEYTFDSAGNVRNADGAVVGVDSYSGWSFDGISWTSGSDAMGGLLYFTGETGNVHINGNNGTVESPWAISVLADGWIAFNGSPVIENYKNPANPLVVQDILFMAGTDIQINGTAGQKLEGVIAAGEQFQFNGTAEIEGVIIAADQANTDDFLTENLMSGTADITYGGDMSLPDSSTDNALQVLAWREMLVSRYAFAEM